MSSEKKHRAGSIVWRDLTVDDADGIRDFYKSVTGWQESPVDMGQYSDYAMLPAGSDEPVAGICHARGPNANLPPQWLVYIAVEDVDASAKRCEELGGKILEGPRAMGNARFCVIQDPAGAVSALIAE